MNFNFKRLKKHIINKFKPFNGKIIILGLNDNSKRHVLYKICLLMRNISKKNYSSFKFLNKQERKQQQNLQQFSSSDNTKILNKTIDREKFNEGSNFKVETVIFNNNKVNIWDVSTDKIPDENLKWQVWQNSIIGTQFLIYCVDASNEDESKIIASRDKLIKLLSDKNLQHISFAVLFNNMETVGSESDQLEKLSKLKQIFSNLNCKQDYKLFGCSSKIIYNENPETMKYLNKNCNYTTDYSSLNKKDFKKYCKMDSMVEMMDWMVTNLA